MKNFLLFIFLIIIGCSQKYRNPNIIIIFTDDQGYGDVGCFGAKGFETPNLDQMAKEGIRFTDFYVSQAVCSASRASLMTGCYNARVDVFGALMPWNQNGLDPSEMTIAKILKQNGYATGVFGKWHVGNQYQFLPLQNGYDEYFGIPYSNDMWPVDYDGNPMTGEKRSYYPDLPLYDGNEIVEYIHTLEDQAQLTTRLTEQALNFIKQNKDQSFFLYFPHPMPHQPIAVSDKFKGKSEKGLYGDVMMEIDWSVGEIMKTLEANRIDNNTLVVFTSDNGPARNFGNWGGSAGGLREGKGTMWEGGARVPCIMRWQGKIQAGTIASNIAATIDLLPTIADIVNVELPEEKIDGVSLFPLLTGDPEANPRNHYFYYYGRELVAVRQGQWKLVFPHTHRSYINVKPGENLYPGPYGRGRSGLELYNLIDDRFETKDVSADNSEEVEQLQNLAETIRQELGDKLTKVKGTEIRSSKEKIPTGNRLVQHLGIGKSLNLKTSADSRYPGESADALVNGSLGNKNYRDLRWQGFQATDLVAMIDLSELQKVELVEVSFLQDQIVWIFLPQKVEISHSFDGVTFETIYEAYPNNEFSLIQDIYRYQVNPANLETRYIQVKGINLNKCPDYHPGAGGKCWVFADEIVVN